MTDIHPDDIGLPYGPLTFVSADQLDAMRAENQRLREAIADALADLTPGYAPWSVLSDALGPRSKATTKRSDQP